MDFTPELVAFQGALISADEIHELQSLSTGGGNENKVKYVIDSLKKFMVAEKYITENGLITAMIPKTRKIAFYIILNTNIAILEDLTDLVEINTLISSAPTISKHLMCEIMWQLHMDPFIYEMISQSWPYLASEIAEAFLENFKYFNPTDCLERLGNLSKACYSLLCRINYFNCEDILFLLTSVSNSFQKFLKYYTNPPKKHLLNALSTDDVYKYKGKRFKNILTLIYNCVNMFTANLNPTCDDPLYKLTYTADYVHNTDVKVCESPSEIILANVVGSSIFMMDIFQEIAMDVNVDMFCAWSEFEDEGKSMQQVVGELCDKVLNSLKYIKTLSEHPVVSVIALMARKPVDINEIINSTEIDIIMEKIYNENEESQLWLHALVFKDPFQDISLVNAVNENIDIYESEECYNLYKKIDMIAIDSANKDLILCTLNQLFHKCNAINKHQLLKEHFRDKILTDRQMNPDFNTEVNGVFNKFIADIDVDSTDVLSLFYQNPRQIFSKLFALATQNMKLIEPMVDLMILLKDYSDYCYEKETDSCMITVIKSSLNQKPLPSPQLCNIVKFISQLKCKEIVTGSQLLMLVIMPSLHEALLSKDSGKMYVHILLLTEAFVIEELISFRAPMFVMLGQMMEILRPNSYDTFQQDSLNVLNTVINFQTSLMDTRKQKVIPNKEHWWLKEKIRNLKLRSVNLYYFRYLWYEDQRNLFNFTKKAAVKDTDIKTLASQLLTLLPWAAMTEWCLLWDSCIDGGKTTNDVLRLFHTVVGVVISHIESNRTPSTVTCLLYCLGNLVHIIRYKYLKEPLTNDQVVLCCALLAHILQGTNRLDVAEIDSVLVPLFSYLAQRKADFTTSLSQYFVNTNYLDTAKKFLSSCQVDLDTT